MKSQKRRVTDLEHKTAHGQPLFLAVEFPVDGPGMFYKGQFYESGDALAKALGIAPGIASGQRLTLVGHQDTTMAELSATG